MTILDPRTTYKPMTYEWAFKAYQQQQQVHWLPSEVSLGDDVRDYRTRLTESELNLLDHIFRFFVQSDIEVSNIYLDVYLPKFKAPELRMMMTSFAAMECVHIEAYALLLDTLGVKESEYSAFLEYKEIRDKYEFINSFNNETTEDLAIAIGVYGGLIEGLSLFAMFAMLMNFQRFGKMKGMCQIVAWSVRDETLHVESMARVFRELVNDLPQLKELYPTIQDHARQLVGHEDRFIELAFSLGDVQGLTQGDMKQYIRFIADYRLSKLGIAPVFGVDANPIPWMEEILNAPEFANFFDSRVTEYSKGASTGSWDDIFN